MWRRLLRRCCALVAFMCAAFLPTRCRGLFVNYQPTNEIQKQAVLTSWKMHWQVLKNAWQFRKRCNPAAVRAFPKKGYAANFRTCKWWGCLQRKRKDKAWAARCPHICHFVREMRRRCKQRRRKFLYTLWEEGHKECLCNFDWQLQVLHAVLFLRMWIIAGHFIPAMHIITCRWLNRLWWARRMLRICKI